MCFFFLSTQCSSNAFVLCRHEIFNLLLLNFQFFSILNNSQNHWDFFLIFVIRARSILLILSDFIQFAYIGRSSHLHFYLKIEEVVQTFENTALTFRPTIIKLATSCRCQEHAYNLQWIPYVFSKEYCSECQTNKLLGNNLVPLHFVISKN